MSWARLVLLPLLVLSASLSVTWALWDHERQAARHELLTQFDFSLGDAVSLKQDLGHSSNVVAVDLCHAAGARRLALFHHEPTRSDDDIQRMHAETFRYEELVRGDHRRLEVVCAYDGLEVAV